MKQAQENMMNELKNVIPAPTSIKEPQEDDVVKRIE